MDRSLWLLLRLRTGGQLRLWGRSLRSLKGGLLLLVGSLVFLPILGMPLLMPRAHVAEQLALVRRFGPLGLFLYCVLNTLLSSGEAPVAFSPAEVNFLFPGPYRRRQLLIYKIVVSSLAAVFSALFVTIVFAHHAAHFWAAFAGLMLALELLQFFSMAVGMIVSTIGVLAFNWGRRLLLVALGAIVAVALLQVGQEALTLGPWQLLARVEQSRAVQAVLTPFRPFLTVFTAERFWPDFVVGSALSLVVIASLLALVLVLNAQYYEASAAASVRIYARLKRARAGGGLSGPSKARFGVPMLPWWGGAGPICWRQLTTATRDLHRQGALLFIFLAPLLLALLIKRNAANESNIALIAIIVLLTNTLIAQSFVVYDFRHDLDRMEDLKALPIAPTRLVIGQLLTPVLVISLGQWLCLALIITLLRPSPALAVGASIMVLPFNALLGCVENLCFLWFPARVLAGNTFDLTEMGRQILLLLAKFTAVAFAAGSAFGLGLGVFWLSESWTASLIVAWIAVAGCVLGLVPLIASAFLQFDIARDTPL